MILLTCHYIVVLLVAVRICIAYHGACLMYFIGVGTTGDIIRVAIRGQPKKAVLVGCAQVQRHGVPRYDTNNIVLLEDNGAPSATKIRVPIPSMLKSKGKNVAKILPNASKFV